MCGSISKQSWLICQFWKKLWLIVTLHLANIDPIDCAISPRTSVSLHYFTKYTNNPKPLCTKKQSCSIKKKIKKKKNRQVQSLNTMCSHIGQTAFWPVFDSQWKLRVIVCPSLPGPWQTRMCSVFWSLGTRSNSNQSWKKCSVSASKIWICLLEVHDPGPTPEIQTGKVYVYVCTDILILVTAHRDLKSKKVRANGVSSKATRLFLAK